MQCHSYFFTRISSGNYGFKKNAKMSGLLNYSCSINLAMANTAVGNEKAARCKFYQTAS